MPTIDWLTEQEAAEWLHLPLEAVQEAIVEGNLPALVIGRHVRISRQALLDLAHAPAKASIAAGTAPRATTDHVTAATGESTAIPPIPLAAGCAWIDDLSPVPTFEYTWPNRNTYTFNRVWQGSLLLNNKTVKAQLGELVIEGSPDWLIVLFDDYPICEPPATTDGQGYASLVKPDGRKVLPWGDPLPALYEGMRVQPYRDATGFKGKGVPTGTSVIIAKDDLRSAVHQGVARWLSKHNLPLVPAS